MQGNRTDFRTLAKPVHKRTSGPAGVQPTVQRVVRRALAVPVFKSPAAAPLTVSPLKAPQRGPDQHHKPSRNPIQRMQAVPDGAPARIPVSYREGTIYYHIDDHSYHSADGARLVPQPHSVLLVGEGNFEYSGLLQQRHPEWLVKGTELETENDVRGRARARQALRLLEEGHGAGAEAGLEGEERRGRLRNRVQFGVDATDMRAASPRRHNELRWVFPHAGGGGSTVEEKQSYVALNEPILRGFFRSAREKLQEGGTVKISLKQTPPYYYIDLFQIAKEAGFQPVKAKPFKAREGFVHSQTGSQKRVSPVGETTYSFQMVAEEAGAGLVRPPWLPAPPPIRAERAAQYGPVPVPAALPVAAAPPQRQAQPPGPRPGPGQPPARRQAAAPAPRQAQQGQPPPQRQAPPQAPRQAQGQPPPQRQAPPQAPRQAQGQPPRQRQGQPQDRRRAGGQDRGGGGGNRQGQAAAAANK
jgi:Domain of unknown function (DUF2431)